MARSLQLWLLALALAVAAAALFDDGRSERPTAQPSSAPALPEGVVVGVGSIVNARWKGQEQFFTGEIVRVHADATVDIQYDDGDFEAHVHASLLSPVQVDGPLYYILDSAGYKVRRGVRVLARWKEGSKLYPGTVIEVHRTGLLDVKYDDGDLETAVDPSMVQRVLSKAALQASEERQVLGLEDSLRQLRRATSQATSTAATAAAAARRDQAPRNPAEEQQPPTESAAGASPSSHGGARHAEQRERRRRRQSASTSRTAATQPESSASASAATQSSASTSGGGVSQSTVPTCRPGSAVVALYPVRVFFIAPAASQITNCRCCVIDINPIALVLRFQGNQQWYPAKIQSIEAERGFVLISWDDGDPNHRRIHQSSHIRGCRAPELAGDRDPPQRAATATATATAAATATTRPRGRQGTGAAKQKEATSRRPALVSPAWRRLQNVVLAKVCRYRGYRSRAMSTVRRSLNCFRLYRKRSD